MFFTCRKFTWLKNITNFYTRAQFQGQAWLFTTWTFPSVIMEANRSIPHSSQLPDRKARSALESEVKCILSVCCSTSAHSRPQSYVCTDEADERTARSISSKSDGMLPDTVADGNQEVIVRVVPKTRKKWSVSLRESLGQQCTGSLSLMGLWHSSLSWESVI